MYFSSLPQGYPGADSNITVSLAGCDPDKITEVRIMKDGLILGIKRYRGETDYDVNVSCYLRDTIKVEPATTVRLAFSDADYRMALFNVTATQYSAAEDSPGPMGTWIDSGLIVYTAGSRQCRLMTPLSDLDWMEISTGESLEIAFIAQGTRLVSSGSLSLDRGTAYDNAQFLCEKDSGMYIYRLTPDFFEKEIEVPIDGSMDILLQISSSGSENGNVSFNCPVEVRDKVAGSVRLCWQNRYGAVDYHTFSPVAGETLRVDKERVVTSSGPGIKGLRTERTFTVCSPFMAASRISQLWAITASPRVWIVEGTEVTPVEIITSKCESSAEGPQQLILTCRLPE